MDNCISKYEKEGILLPSRLKKYFKDRCISKVHITAGLDGCLFIFSEQDWEAQKSKFMSISFTKKQAAKMQKIYFPPRPLHPVNDQSAYIPIDEELKKFAGIKDDILFVWRYNKVEIWDRERYEKQSVN